MWKRVTNKTPLNETFLFWYEDDQDNFMVGKLFNTTETEQKVHGTKYKLKMGKKSHWWLTSYIPISGLWYAPVPNKIKAKIP